jgi:putative membrane protein insertion efficiency factor
MAKTESPGAHRRASASAKALLLMITAYRYLISPLLPSRCRFYPTCSAYAAEAIQRHGALQGGRLALKRLSKCHPWGSHGVDLVPNDPESSTNCCQRKP